MIVQSADTVLAVLLHVSTKPDLTLSQIARDMGETKPKIMRMLRTLEHRGLVAKSEDGTFKLGNAALVVSSGALTQIDIVCRAAPILESLCVKTNETVQLRVRDQGDALCIAKYEPSRDLRVQATVGRRRPLHAGSAKVLLAYLPETVRRGLLPEKLEKVAGGTILDHEQLECELSKIRGCGYCISRGEMRDHLCSVAVPVWGEGGVVLASLNVAAPSFRTQQADIDRFVELLRTAAKEISDKLGHKAM